MSAARDILVLQTSADELRLIKTRIQRGAVRVLDACTLLSHGNNQSGYPLTDQTVVDALAKQVSRHGWAGSDLVCVLGGPKVACHYYDMPPLKGNSLRQAALLKLGQQLHFDVADAVVAVRVLGTAVTDGAEQLRVHVAAVQRALALEAIAAVEAAGLNLVAITAAPAAIAALIQEVASDGQGVEAVLHVDERVSSLVVLKAGTPQVSTELPIGLSDLNAALMRPIIVGEGVLQLDEARAASLRNEVGIPAADQYIESINANGERLLPLLEPALQKFAKQVTQWLTFAATTTGGMAVRELKLIGPGSSVPGLPEAIASRTSRQVRPEEWLSKAVSFEEESDGQALESYAAAIGAARHLDTMPDLMPPQTRRAQRLRSIRRSVVWCGPFVAAATLTFAVMFERVVADLAPAISAQTDQIAGVQEIIGTNRKWQVEEQIVGQLQKKLDDFTSATPGWTGLLKELSILLPTELQATDFVARSGENGITLTINGRVFTQEGGRGFDEVVSQTLRLLQDSAFFSRVQPLAANRDGRPQADGATGTLSVELELVYPHGPSGV